MFIELKNVAKTYESGEVKIEAAKNISFGVEKGELVVVLGPSGAGKTTVLNILGGMDTPTRGEIIVDGKHIENFNKRELVTYRHHDIGFVFQFYNLIQNLTALENVELSNQMSRETLNAEAVLKDVGLSKRMHNFPSQLSGGEQQRVAIARALAKNPKLLLCDEPTGALDSKTGIKVLEVLQNTSRRYNMTVVIITHNVIIAGIADKVIKMKNGTIEDIVINKNPKDVKELVW